MIDKGWTIQDTGYPKITHVFWHDEYDADIDGDNGLAGNGSSYDDCVQQIEEIEEEHWFFSEGESDEDNGYRE